MRLLLVLTILTTSLACSPPEGPVPPDSIERTMFYSDVVVAAQVTARLRNRTTSGSLYDVEAQIWCVYKAPKDFPVNQTVTIQMVGYDGGLCYATTLTVGMEYIVFLSYAHEHGQLVPSDTQKSMTQVNMRYLASVCDTKLVVPQGTPSAKSSQCPAPEGGSTCRRFSGANQQTALHVALWLLTALLTAIYRDCFI